MRWGAVYQYFPWYLGESTQPGVIEYVLRSAIGISLRGTWPRPASGFGLRVRSVMLGGTTPYTKFVPRLGLTY